MELDSKYCSLDTCIILRLIFEDVPEQYILARDLVLSGRDFYIDGAAISESIYVMIKLGRKRPDIVDSLQNFLRNPMFIYDAAFFDPIFQRYLTHPSLSFDDCVLEARATAKKHLPLWTFDKKFAKQSEAARLLTY